MKAIDVEELKIIQLEILDYVDDFCKHHGIKYSLSGGTLIGAIRHHGFIPWDDDIDIQLLREDYDLFIEEWNKYEHPYVFHNVETKSNKGTAYGKISNPKTIMKDGDTIQMGVNIDVFPIDKVIDMDDFYKRHAKILNLYFYHWRVSRQWKWNFKILIWKFWGMIFCPAYYERKINSLAKKYQGKEAPFLFEMIAGRGYKNPWPLDAFRATVDVSFENKRYQALIGYHEYLTATFGNYMQLPPEEKQVSHHRFEAWWKEYPK
ncbi:MAG: LicD family protein [Prevotellaceae bacterium]|nr:LicD family protein [Candidatus Faecinaster equi]MBQ0165315.1 LicD family protein [Candidatus Equimonas faecalis]